MAAAFLLVVTAVVHLLFSWMGFTPTDDGFTLAYSRRILEGQVPHRDFIIIRPFLSPLIHTPFVLFGGEYTFWLSRLFVWFQFATISWIWVSVINKAFKFPFGWATEIFVALVCFAASANLFPLMAWHTIDGMFLTSLGVWLLATREGAYSRGGGYFLIALSYLCKQSFGLVAPLTLLILGDWREKKYWASIAMPGAAYAVYLLITGALDEAISQITSQTGLFEVGVVSYINYGVALGGAAGLGGLALLNLHLKTRPRLNVAFRYAGVAALILTPSFFVSYGLYTTNISTVSYGIFGMLSGAFIYCALTLRARRLIGPDGKDESRVTLLVLVLAWSVSLSFGANSPLLATGLLLVTLVAFACSTRYEFRLRFPRLLLAISGVIILICFGLSRPVHIYNEDSYKQLTEPLGGVLPGGSLIYTNPDTYALMEELRRNTDRISASGKEYAIIPDIPGYWAKAEQTNPLPIDWLFPVELGNKELVDRVIQDVEAERGETVIIVQKVNVFLLEEEIQPLNRRDYPVVRHVRKHFDKVGETRFFELYE